MICAHRGSQLSQNPGQDFSVTSELTVPGISCCPYYGQRSLVATVQAVAKSWTRLSTLHFHFHYCQSHGKCNLCLLGLPFQVRGALPPAMPVRGPTADGLASGFE